MTAAELFEIVKDVPREAWPRGGDEWGTQQIVFQHGQWDMQTHIGQNIAAVPAWLAEHAFIGSMTAELHRNGYTVDSYSTEAGARLYVRDAHTGHDLGGVLKFSAPSLVAALAAACKEAA